MLVIQNKEHFQKVEKFANEQRILEALTAQLVYLHLYACSWDDIERTKVTIGYDYAKHSFSVTIERRTPEGDYKHWMIGGLIFNADTKSWSVHT